MEYQKKGKIKITEPQLCITFILQVQVYTVNFRNCKKKEIN